MYAARSIYVLQHAGSLAVRRRVKHTLCSTQNEDRSIKKKLDTSDQQLWTSHTATKCGGAGVEEDVRWLHPADRGTLRMEGAHQERMFQFPTPYTLNTEQPLQRDHVREALSDLWRKVPALRTCLRYRHGRLWLCELKKPTLDFEIANKEGRESLKLQSESASAAEQQISSTLCSAQIKAKLLKCSDTHRSCHQMRSFHSVKRCTGIGLKDDVNWLYPADSSTLRMEAAHQHGMLQYPNALTINTAKPLNLDHVTQALWHLCRKIPALRTCLRHRDGKVWLCELKNPVIDFEVVEGPEPLTEVKVMLNNYFDSSAEGPLWRVRLLPNAADVPCPVPEVKVDYPHQYNLLISVHHGVVDGSSSMFIIDALLRILDDVIGGVPLNEEQIGVNRDESETLKLLRESEDEIDNNPQKFHAMAEQCSRDHFLPLLTEAFGEPEVSEPKTHYLILTLPKSTMNEFVKKCKLAGVTFNSGLLATFDLGLVELVKEAGLVRDSYSITSRHAVNLRRYWPSHSIWPYGCHISAIYHTLNTPHNIRDNFWEYARQFNTEFRDKVNNKYVFHEQAIKKKLLQQSPNYYDLYSKPQKLICDYFLSNVQYESTSAFGIGKHLQLTGMSFPAMIHHCEFGMVCMVSNFRGGLQGTVSYSTGYITDAIAKRLYEKILAAITSVAE